MYSKFQKKPLIINSYLAILLILFGSSSCWLTSSDNSRAAVTLSINLDPSNLTTYEPLTALFHLMDFIEEKEGHGYILFEPVYSVVDGDIASSIESAVQRLKHNNNVYGWKDYVERAVYEARMEGSSLDSKGLEAWVESCGDDGRCGGEVDTMHEMMMSVVKNDSEGLFDREYVDQYIRSSGFGVWGSESESAQFEPGKIKVNGEGVEGDEELVEGVCKAALSLGVLIEVCEGENIQILKSYVDGKVNRFNYSRLATMIYAFFSIVIVLKFVYNSYK